MKSWIAKHHGKNCTIRWHFDEIKQYLHDGPQYDGPQ